MHFRSERGMLLGGGAAVSGGVDEADVAKYRQQFIRR
jgi:hypothetical protein